MTDTLLDGVASARGDIGPGDVVLPSLGQKKHAGENSKNKEKPWRTIGDLRGYVFKQKSKVIKFANKLWWRSRRRDKTSSAIPGNVSFEIKGSGLNSQSPSRYHRSPYTAGVAIWDSKDDFQMGNETAYFDTLSPANFMSESLVERCHLRPAPILVKDLERFTGFTDGPDDDGVTPRQFVEVRLCSSQLKLPCVVAVFLVVNNPPEDLICGWQFLQDHNILPRFPYRASRGVLPITKGNPTAEDIRKQEIYLRKIREAQEAAARFENSSSTSETTRAQTSNSGEATSSSRPNQATSATSNQPRR